MSSVVKPVAEIFKEVYGQDRTCDVSDKLFLEHFVPNPFHPETGIYLLWWVMEGQKINLVDWELYSKNPARGGTEQEAFDKMILTVDRFTRTVPQ